jgi:hypothetical protein
MFDGTFNSPNVSLSTRNPLSDKPAMVVLNGRAEAGDTILIGASRRVPERRIRAEDDGKRINGQMDDDDDDQLEYVQSNADFWIFCLCFATF